MFELLPNEIKHKIIDYLNITLKKTKIKKFEYYSHDCALPRITKYIIIDYTYINKELYRLIKLKKCECCYTGAYINNKCNTCGYCLPTHFMNYKQKYSNIHNNYLNYKSVKSIININKKRCLRNHKKT